MAEKFRMPQGRFKGVLITRIPPAYLKWMVNTRHQLSSYAKEELERRGTHEHNIEVTSHAVDRASTRLFDKFLAEAGPEEGIWTWLSKKAEKALEEYNGPLHDNLKIYSDEIVYIFETKFVIPVLKSVWLTGDADEKK